MVLFLSNGPVKDAQTKINNIKSVILSEGEMLIESFDGTKNSSKVPSIMSIEEPEDTTKFEFEQDCSLPMDASSISAGLLNKNMIKYFRSMNLNVGSCHIGNAHTYIYCKQRNNSLFTKATMI